jgi:acyl transferase domain-containing protein
MENYHTFDHRFFKNSPREMAFTDPQHRLMLQVAYQAVEQSVYFRDIHTNPRIQCFMGVGNVDYKDNIACYPANAYSTSGNLKSFLAAISAKRLLTVTSQPFLAGQRGDLCSL